MALYKVWIKLEEEYDDIEADSEEEAFIIASDAAMQGGSWYKKIELIEDEQIKKIDFKEAEHDQR